MHATTGSEIVIPNVLAEQQRKERKKEIIFQSN